MIKRLLFALYLAPSLAFAAFVPPGTILLDNREYEINADASYTRTTEWMVRVDTQQGVDIYGQAKLYFNGKTGTQTVLEAYTLKPSGEKIPVTPDRIKVRNEASDELSPYFSDSMNTVIIFPQVEIGSKLYYKAVTKQTKAIIPGHFSVNIFFSPHHRYENTRIRLTHPSELNLLAESRDVSGSRRVLPDGRIQYVYHFKQDKAYPPEPNRVELIDFAPGIQFTTFANYRALAKTFQGLMQPKTEVTPHVRKLAQQLTRGTETQRQKAQKLYDWVSANIRYVGTDVGASGYEPHSADEILSHQYGDCKDHVVLLESLLLAVGISSSPALINMEDAYQLPKLAGKNFDHVITYIPEFDLYLDSTAQFAEYGTLYPQIQGKPTLLTQSGSIHATPNSSSARDYTVTRTKMTLMPDGKIVGTVNYTPHGAYIYSSRSAQFNNEDQDSQSVVDKLLGRFQESGTGKISHPNPNDLSTTWKVKSEFELDPVINLPGPSAMAIPTGLGPGYVRTHAKERQFKDRRYPYVCGSDKHIEDFTISFPKNVKVTRVPSGVAVDLGYQNYKSSYQLTGNELKGLRVLSVEIGKDVCQPNINYETERSIMMDTVKADLRNQIFID